MSIHRVTLFLTAIILGSSRPLPQADALGQPDPSGTGAITGKILDAQGQPAARVIVVLCTDAGGIPVHNRTSRPITEAYATEKGESDKEIAYAVTDDEGRFSFGRVAQGEYRLVGQSWPDIESIKGLFEVNAKVIELHGIAEHIVVSPGSSQDVVIRPLGTGALEFDADMPNDETLMVISTKPTRADPILGFAGWSGQFMRNMIGGNRMPGGETTVYGLPEGKIYFAMFAADSVPGWTDGQVEIEPNAITVLDKIQFVNSWSNSRHHPPEELKPLVEELKLPASLPGDHPIMKLYAKLGRESEGGIRRSTQAIIKYMDEQLELPSGRKVTFGQVMAAQSYIQLEQFVEKRTQKRKRRSTLIAEYRARYEARMAKGEKPEPIDYTSADTFFPDDPEAGKEFDALLMNKDSIFHAPPYGDWLDIIRRGFRRASIDKSGVIGTISYKYIRGKSPPNQPALDIVYYASFDPQYLPGAVYSGLSIVDPKPPKVLNRLVDIALEYRELGRIAWGVKQSKQQGEFIAALEPYRNSPDSKVRERAETVVKVFEGKIDGRKLSQELDLKRREQKRQEEAAKVREQFGHELPEVKQALIDGDSEARLAALRRIVVNRLTLIIDAPFFEAFEKCAADENAEVRKRTATILGRGWIWGARPQSPEAIEIVMRLSKDEDLEVRNKAVYFGLSVVRDKDEKIIKRLIDLALDEDAQADVGRISWGLRNSVNKEIIKTYLRSYLDLENDTSEVAKRLYREIFKDEPSDE